MYCENIFIHEKSLCELCTILICVKQGVGNIGDGVRDGGREKNRGIAKKIVDFKKCCICVKQQVGNIGDGVRDGGREKNRGFQKMLHLR